MGEKWVKLWVKNGPHFALNQALNCIHFDTVNADQYLHRLEHSYWKIFILAQKSK